MFSDSTPVTILSPHQDDAALSLSLAMRYWISQGQTIRVLNCFTNSSYAPYATTDDVRHLRTQEDRAALPLEMEIENLDLPDAPIRLGCSANEVCGRSWTKADREVRETIQSRIDGIPLILAPLAFFGHIDHEIVSQAARTAATRVIFYEDLPYVTRVDEGEQARCRAALGNPPLGQTLIVGSLAAKEHSLRQYRSQLSSEEIDIVMNYTRSLGGERLWFQRGTFNGR